MRKYFFLLVLISIAICAKSNTLDLDNYDINYINDTIVAFTDGEKYGIATIEGKIIVPLQYDYIKREVNKFKKELFFFVCKDDKWGIVSDKKEYVEPRYDFIGQTAKGRSDRAFLSFRQNNKWGLVYINGEELLSPEYDVILFYASSFFYDIIIFSKEGQWSVMDPYNLDPVEVSFDIDYSMMDCYAIINEERYALKGSFYDGRARVSRNDKFGIIDTQGNIIVPTEYDGIATNFSKKDIYIVEKDGKAGLVKKNRLIAPCLYDNFIASTPDSLNFFFAKGEDIYKIDMNGNAQRQPTVESLKKKFTFVIDCNNDQAIVYINNLAGVMNYDGTVAIPCKYNKIQSMNENNEILLMYQALKGIEERQYYKVYNNRGLCAAFNEKGNQLTDFKYIDMRYVGGNHEAFAVATQNGDNGIIGICDSTGREIVTPKYEKTNIARGNVFPLKLNNKWGLVNASNNVVYPFEIDKVDPYFNFHNYFDKDEFFLAVSKGDKWALVDDDGALLCDFAFEKDGTDLTSNSAILNESYHEGMAVARIHKNDEFMYGFFDKSGKLAIPCIYSFACNFCNGLARVENDMDKFGYINKQGETVLPFIYDWAGDFDTTTQTAQVRIGIKHLVINTKGEVVANKW